MRRLFSRLNYKTNGPPGSGHAHPPPSHPFCPTRTYRVYSSTARGEISPSQKQHPLHSVPTSPVVHVTKCLQHSSHTQAQNCYTILVPYTQQLGRGRQSHTSIEEDAIQTNSLERKFSTTTPVLLTKAPHYCCNHFPLATLQSACSTRHTQDSKLLQNSLPHTPPNLTLYSW